MTLTGTMWQSRPGSNDSEGVHHIPQSSRTRASPSDALVSYSGYSSPYECPRYDMKLSDGYPSAEIQSAYSIASVDRAISNTNNFKQLYLIHRWDPNMY